MPFCLAFGLPLFLFNTEEGIAMFCRIRSYLSTLRKQGIALLPALDHTFSGTPVLPAFT